MVIALMGKKNDGLLVVLVTGGSLVMVWRRIDHLV